MGYNPLTGDDYTQAEAVSAWSGTMRRSGPEWAIRGHFPAGEWHWGYWNFKPHAGRVTVEPDGFHWSTVSYDTGELILAGVTRSLYEAYQSAVQNRVVVREPAS